MAVRVRYNITAAVSSTIAEERDLGNVNWSVVTDVEAKGGTWKTTLPSGTADLLLQIDNVATIQMLLIRTTPTDPTTLPNGVSFKRNSSVAESILILPLGDSKEGHFLISTDSLTSIYISNAGPVSMDVVLTVAGI